MLVLSRKNRESVVIGADDGVHRLMKVTVLAIKGANVKLGFEVDDDVPVHRSEVWEQINLNSHEPSHELEEFTASYGETVAGI
jgi:carbon storage regulator